MKKPEQMTEEEKIKRIYRLQRTLSSVKEDKEALLEELSSYESRAEEAEKKFKIQYGELAKADLDIRNGEVREKNLQAHIKLIEKERNELMYASAQMGRNIVPERLRAIEVLIQRQADVVNGVLIGVVSDEKLLKRLQGLLEQQLVEVRELCGTKKAAT